MKKTSEFNPVGVQNPDRVFGREVGSDGLLHGLTTFYGCLPTQACAFSVFRYDPHHSRRRVDHEMEFDEVNRTKGVQRS